jgi:hypothetical protein
MSAATSRNDSGDEERADRATNIAAHLKERLRHATMACGGEGGDTGGLGMDDCGAQTDEEDRDRHSPYRVGEGDKGEANESEDRGDIEGAADRVAVEDITDDRLEDRGGELVDERDETNLRIAKSHIVLDEGVGCGDDRLHKVVEEVAGAEGEEDRHSLPEARVLIHLEMLTTGGEDTRKGRDEQKPTRPDDTKTLKPRGL